MNLKKLLPKTFFGRSLAIIIIPMLILQTVLTYFFYERHWEDVGRRLVLGLGGAIVDRIFDVNICKQVQVKGTSVRMKGLD